ncbi:efflux RND transporter permease subunit [Chelativorans intermedius]|uniref:Efflux RND transporter permease subunit n=1 Tax=Chelativorans intermedius TaxID=515947 RepID=A0ABV6DAW7_9HYPH|nr:efflux RND transporter permease subunit [Chelativorans intermedius]MCT9000157.1 efflux RND transporter permease subunit [Chelativorans intermedius]
MSNLSSWSIRHPVPTIVLFVILVLAGIAGYRTLGINNMPDMDIPTITVTVEQPGARPSELETQVTRIVEDAVAGLGNVDHIRSTVTEGVSTTNVEFALGIDMQEAVDDVRNAVSGIRGNLPADAEEPLVQELDVSGGAILTFVVSAPTMNPQELSWFVDSDVAKAVLSVPGVSKIERSGGVDREIRVSLDPGRLMALEVTAAEISRQLGQVNTNQPGGRATIGEGEQAIRMLGSAPTVEALANTRIALSDGRAIRLKHVGRVEDRWAEPRQRARLDGEEVVAFSVYRTTGSSEVEVAQAARAKVNEIDRARDIVTIEEVTSSTDHVVESYNAALEALWLGALLTVVAIWLFLRDGRATVIGAVSLPTSLIPTFAVMGILGISFTNITLLALALMVGILVDDAIVEIENIVRHMRQSGKSVHRAAMEAADEIWLAVVATTATIVAVFLPVAFVPGVPGQFFRDFAIVACVSSGFSLLTARMLTPLMGAFLLKDGRRGRDEPFWLPTYLWLLRTALRFRAITLVIGIAFFAASLALMRFLPTEFAPVQDRGRSVLSVELPPGATLAETDTAVVRATDILKGFPEVETVYASVGAPVAAGGMAVLHGGGGGAAGEVRKATVTVNLKPRGERGRSQQAFERAAAEALAAIPGARMRFGGEGQSGATIAIRLASDDPNALSLAIDALERDMRKVPGIRNAASTSSLAQPELLIMPKPDKAAELGVSAAALAQTVGVATLGAPAQSLPKFNLPDRQIPIRVMLDEKARNDVGWIAGLQLPAGGAIVPLGSVADISFGVGPTEIARLDRQRSATVEGELVGLTLGQALEQLRAMPAMRNLPPGVVEIPGGDAERMGQLFGGFAMAITSGVVLMYAVLVLLFGTFIQPITLLTALPLSLGGALGALAIAGQSLAVSALIGILLLMGIAAKNSILLVEYTILARRERGLDRTSALIDAARKRARPIIMTSVAMGAGMLPIALGIGAGAEFRAPMAIVVIGGLVSSTALSLLYVPVVYTFMDELERRLGRVLRRLVVRPPQPEADSSGAD